MNKLLSITGFLLIVFTTPSCKDRYYAKLPPGQSNYLVVEGYINPGGFTTLTLARTLPLGDPAKIKPELNAVVSITGEDNSELLVRSIGNGTYRSDSLSLNSGQKYRLHIKTNAGGEYLSEYVAVRRTPPIDSISWKIKNDGVEIYVNTHDPQNNTRYYKWDYEETWEIHSTFINFYKYVNGFVLPTGYTPQELDKFFYCWVTQKSVNILTGSSAHLSNDVISEAPVMFIPFNSEKTSVRYSILVKQYSLDRKGFDFYKLMKSNTESLGSVFDPLPSEIAGNISCVSNPSEKVIGYITTSEVDEKRIFILRSQIPSTHQNGCESIYVVNHPDSLVLYFGSGRYAPHQADGTRPDPPKGYYGTFPFCFDCTLRGSNVKPSSW